MRNSEVTLMENCGNEARALTEDGSRKQDPGSLEATSNYSRSGEDNRFVKAAASRNTGAQGTSLKRDVASWVNWQSALYLFVLGGTSILLVPLTSFWWLALVCGTASY